MQKEKWLMHKSDGVHITGFEASGTRTKAFGKFVGVSKMWLIKVFFLADSTANNVSSPEGVETYNIQCASIEEGSWPFV